MNLNYYNNRGYCYKFLLGATGPIGPTGEHGITGPQGGTLNFADFYALMPLIMRLLLLLPL